MQFGWIYWDPNPVIFTFPVINRPIVWYGLFFALGFFLGYFVFRFFLHKYLKKKPYIQDEEIIKSLFLKKKFTEDQTKILQGKKDPKSVYTSLNSYIKKGKNNEDKNQRRLYLEKIFAPYLIPIKKKATKIADKTTSYVVIATVVGARLFHVFFYQDPSTYLNNPFSIIAVWQGGLASHGAAIAIVIALFILAKKLRNLIPPLDMLTLLDLIATPALIAGAFIRIGNFTNQEILGTKTNVFWAVVFGTPAGGSIPTPRHPVTLYEAIVYFLLFLFFFYLKTRTSYLQKKGQTIGLFLVSVFTFRFFIEFVKERQSDLLATDYFLTMGQYLSVPLVLLGIFFLLYPRLKIT